MDSPLLLSARLGSRSALRHLPLPTLIAAGVAVPLRSEWGTFLASGVLLYGLSLRAERLFHRELEPGTPGSRAEVGLVLGYGLTLGLLLAFEAFALALGLRAPSRAGLTLLEGCVVPGLGFGLGCVAAASGRMVLGRARALLCATVLLVACAVVLGLLSMVVFAVVAFVLNGLHDEQMVGVVTQLMATCAPVPVGVLLLLLAAGNKRGPAVAP